MSSAGYKSPKAPWNWARAAAPNRPTWFTVTFAHLPGVKYFGTIPEMGKGKLGKSSGTGDMKGKQP